MDFNVKLQELRKQKNITQEELAEAIYVSRTAISKWESGRGYPNIDSLKALSAFFEVSIDELLSGNELLNIAEEDGRQKQTKLCERVFGLLDVCAALLLFLPIFAQRIDGEIKAVSLLELSSISVWASAFYCFITIALVVLGIVTLVFQGSEKTALTKLKINLSLIFNTIGMIAFMLGLHPYSAIYLLAFLIIKILILTKKQ